MNIIADELMLGRGSELNGVRRCCGAKQLGAIPRDCHIAYDKGIPGIFGILPNYNHCFMPAFLAPAKGKTQFDVKEAIHGRGVARNRNVVEIGLPTRG